MLYKHRAIDDYFWPLLEAGKIWCPSAHTLNDPFEFNFRLKEPTVYGYPIIQSELEQAKAVMKNYGVVSLVEINDSILMWTYYSASHTGVCLGFERNDSNDLGNYDFCVPVIYHTDKEVPAYMPLDLTKQDKIAKIFTTKYKEWSHEHEWRFLTFKSDAEIDYPGRLAHVIFGIKTKIEHRNRIMKMLGDTVDYFEVSKSRQYFALSIDPVIAPASQM